MRTGSRTAAAHESSRTEEFAGEELWYLTEEGRPEWLLTSPPRASIGRGVDQTVDIVLQGYRRLTTVTQVLRDGSWREISRVPRNELIKGRKKAITVNSGSTMEYFAAKLDTKTLGFIANVMVDGSMCQLTFYRDGRVTFRGYSR